ncbi:hypothetical protein FA95DRAFT_126089 [Auriscalpium vulgare]|uniref:Uncharacterized protein n=1 Tax=Auriscalpium vulgare TaxID=40419 RepID=A0ACB8RMZ4_9AGAM|nr:hypothetical protein FA95DRAFT_126089 [Auriscalpium vulgare]
MCAAVRAARRSSLESRHISPFLMDSTAGISIKIPIPDTIISILIPPHTLSISGLLQFPTTPTRNPPILPRQNLFSKTKSLIDSSSARSILSLTIPSLEDVRLLAGDARRAVDDGMVSFLYPTGQPRNSDTQNSVRMPIWVITFWHFEHPVIKAKTAWASALNWLEGKSMSAEYPPAKHLLTTLPWNTSLPVDIPGEPSSLAQYLSPAWLSDDHMDQMGSLLGYRLIAAGQTAARILPTLPVRKLLQIYRQPATRDAYHTTRNISHLHNPGQSIRDHTLWPQAPGGAHPCAELVGGTARRGGDDADPYYGVYTPRRHLFMLNA